MADIEPLRALHYDLPRRGRSARSRSAALRRDRRRAAGSELARFALQRGRRRPAARRGSLRARRGALREWQADGVVVRDEEPALWAHEQRYSGPDGTAADAARVLRPGSRRGVRRRADPPARAHAPRTEGGPPAPDAGDEGEPLADLLAVLRPAGAAWGALEPGTAGAPWGEVSDATAPSTGSGGRRAAGDRARVKRTLAGVELLIADGHHRYETARVYAEEIGGEGEHRYVLMCLVALEDPGLTVFPTHRLVRGPRRAALEALDAAIGRDFARRRSRASRSRHRPVKARSSSATSTSAARPQRLTAARPGDRRRGAAGRARRPTSGSTRACSRSCC
jgi:hypothetical protein